jgi:hypothetical protein
MLVMMPPSFSRSVLYRDAPAPRRTKAEVEAQTTNIAESVRHVLGMTETARSMGEHRQIVSSTRQQLGITTERHYTPKSGNPEHANGSRRRAIRRLSLH